MKYLLALFGLLFLTGCSSVEQTLILPVYTICDAPSDQPCLTITKSQTGTVINVYRHYFTDPIIVRYIPPEEPNQERHYSQGYLDGKASCLPSHE